MVSIQSTTLGASFIRTLREEGVDWYCRQRDSNRLSTGRQIALSKSWPSDIDMTSMRLKLRRANVGRTVGAHDDSMDSPTTELVR